jgi:cytochrome P450
MDLTSDPEELLVVVMNFIIAGRDTTAQSLSWFFFELLANPQHLAVIRAELAEAFGAPEGGIRLEYEQVKMLPYTLACWSEAIRLHPAVPKNGKEVVADDVIVPQGPNPDNLPSIPVFKGEKVGWSDWVMNRLPAVWGEDAAEYNPLRFLERDTEGKWTYVQHSQWKYHVFNVSRTRPRPCFFSFCVAPFAEPCCFLGRPAAVPGHEPRQLRGPGAHRRHAAAVRLPLGLQGRGPE